MTRKNDRIPIKECQEVIDELKKELSNAPYFIGSMSRFYYTKLENGNVAQVLVCINRNQDEWINPDKHQI